MWDYYGVKLVRFVRLVRFVTFARLVRFWIWCNWLLLVQVICGSNATFDLAWLWTDFHISRGIKKSGEAGRQLGLWWHPLLLNRGKSLFPACLTYWKRSDLLGSFFFSLLCDPKCSTIHVQTDVVHSHDDDAEEKRLNSLHVEYNEAGLPCV